VKVTHNMVVQLCYQLSDSSGKLIEDRTPENPFEYLHGYGSVLPVLEKYLEGKSPGFIGALDISQNEGYGEYRDDLIVEIEKDELPEGFEFEIGRRFSTEGPNGEPAVVTVIDESDEKVVLDGNHPLAGLTLRFELRIVEVRNGSAQEIKEQRAMPDAGEPDRDDLH
jgi:FKBP-type peptidyl-prolyl cis-trans isomerase SlyD